MGTLQLSPNVLEWAANNVGISVDLLADKVAATSKREAFIQGKLTPSQAEQVSKLTHIPFGFLFLEAPPTIEKRTLPDLRQTPNPEPLSHDFYDTLDDILRKQEWYADHLKEMGEDPLPFVGRYSVTKVPSYAEVALDIKKTIGLSDEDRNQCSNFEDYYDLLTQKIEAAGILLFKSGIVRSNTKRGLSVKEFRGFAIADKLAPVIFINGKDSPAAWIFTLAHEVAHIWLGQSGISDNPAGATSNKAELACNRIAAELLTPTQQFIEAWEKNQGANIDELSRIFKVSRLVIARRALDLKKTSLDFYKKIEEASKKQTTTSGGNPYYTIPVRNSKRFTHSLVVSAMSGHTMIREAARLLNIKPNTLMELGRRLAKRG